MVPPPPHFINYEASLTIITGNLAEKMDEAVKTLVDHESEGVWSTKDNEEGIVQPYKILVFKYVSMGDYITLLAQSKIPRNDFKSGMKYDKLWLFFSAEFAHFLDEADLSEVRQNDESELQHVNAKQKEKGIYLMSVEIKPIFLPMLLI